MIYMVFDKQVGNEIKASIYASHFSLIIDKFREDRCFRRKDFFFKVLILLLCTQFLSV